MRRASAKHGEQIHAHTEEIKVEGKGFRLLNLIHDITDTAVCMYLKKLDKFIEIKGRNGLIEVKEASTAICVDESYIKSFFYDLRRKQNLQGFFFNNETFVLETVLIRKISTRGKVDFVRLSSNLGISTDKTKEIVKTLFWRGKIKGTFTLDGKYFITENKLREIIRKSLYA